jgi:glycosyltransferase involved in cell wall biosynthesis
VIGSLAAVRGSSLKIVQLVCSADFAGVERSLTYVAPELARRGHEVTVIGGDPSRVHPPLRDGGVVFVPAARAADGLRGLLAQRYLHPDVVHSHMTAADLVSIVALPVVRAPRVSTLHFAQPRGRSPMRREAYRGLPRLFRAQLAISAFVAETCGTPSVVVPNGVPGREATTERRERVVLVAQRLEPEKDTELALEAWHRCGLRRSGWRLEIAGEGAERRRLQSLARSLGVEETVHILGFVDDMAERMDRASLFLATAPVEPFGLSVVEAMAAGVPVVAAEGGAHQELFAGFERQLFRPGDPEGCARLLDHFGADEALRSDAKARGRTRYEERYTIERQVDRLEDVYGQVASGRRLP